MTFGEGAAERRAGAADGGEDSKGHRRFRLRDVSCGDARSVVLASRAVTVAAPPSPLARAWTARWPIGVELVLFFVLMAVYEWLRDLVATDDFDRVLGHAHDVVHLERSLGAFVEPDVHHWVQGIAAPGLHDDVDLHPGPHDGVRGHVLLGLVPPARQLRDVPQLVLDHERAGGGRLLGLPPRPAAPGGPGAAGPHEGVAGAGRRAVVVPAVPQRVRGDAVDARGLHVPVRPHDLLAQPGLALALAGVPVAGHDAVHRRRRPPTTGGSTASAASPRC